MCIAWVTTTRLSLSEFASEMEVEDTMHLEIWHAVIDVVHQESVIARDNRK